MTMRGVFFEFAEQTPDPATLVAEAERIGGMALEITSSEIPEQFDVGFVAFPAHRVHVSCQKNHLSLTDVKQAIPALFDLLVNTSIRLGGVNRFRKEGYAEIPLPCPLTEDFIRQGMKEIQRTKTIFGTLFLAFISMMLAAGVAVVIGVAWLLRFLVAS
jgi:hypothetical protein